MDGENAIKINLINSKPHIGAMVHVDRYQPDNVRNGRSRGPSPNGHNVSPDTSDDDCEYYSSLFYSKKFPNIITFKF